MKSFKHISFSAFPAFCQPRIFIFLSTLVLSIGHLLAQTPAPFSVTKYENVGGGSYSVPSGVDRIKVEVWGGGGSGSKVTSYGIAGGGGGGGAYSRSVLSNLSTSPYNLFVGSGGVSNGSGGPSSFGGALVSANGGNGAPGNSATGGAGGTTSGVGTSKFSGGNGANGSYTWRNRYSG